MFAPCRLRKLLVWLVGGSTAPGRASVGVRNGADCWATGEFIRFTVDAAAYR
ncbi:hypothetical protein ACVGVM_15825 [Pseudonocardia bannensis]|uniref:Uncharacterized protein n=1 Tax=Pseudonocardia bannensis TaxID=630973 RepID=A0A848DEK0_9PSEU|nr:hypothetical protein [Pseudonocardia bannensis]NMH90981.1 hypothetical protein [Pseudonocardia bannensis]